MEKELILLSEYCKKSRIEIDFLLRLENEGLIETEIQNNIKYIPVSQLTQIEIFSRLHYELAINIEGIDVIHNLLKRLNRLEKELFILRRQVDWTDNFISIDLPDDVE
ncbi:MAG: chaperone modulator CbpM [Candidatus Azobacteroides sp.]|nr:chaperone modulator CbpM [Candidatus Azobacteroides sp.]